MWRLVYVRLDGHNPQPLVGRSAESARLRSTADAATAGAHAALMLVGPAGIGKTALLDELMAGRHTREALVLRIRCREQSSDISFGAVRDLFGPLGLHPGSGDATLLEGGARLSMPALDRRTTAPDPQNIYPVLHGLYWLTVNLTTRGPLLLVVDDLQWCDDGSLAWLDFLLRRGDGLPLGVVLAARTDGAGALPARLASIAAQLGGDHVPLGPLGRDEVGRLVAGAQVAAAPDAGLLDAFIEASGGNPLLVERLVGALDGVQTVAGDAAALRVHELGREVITTLVGVHVFGGPEHVTAVATAIAVVGAEDTEVLASVAGFPVASVRDACATLRRTDIFAAQEPDFRHDLLRAAVLEQMPVAELDALRRRAARVLSDAGRPAEIVAAVLLQLSCAVDPWMAGVLLEAAASAAHRGSQPAVARYLRPVVAAAPADVSARLGLAAALAQTAPYEAVAQLREALDLAPDLRTRAKVAVQLAMTSLAVQEAPAAVRVLGAVLDELHETYGPDLTPADAELRTTVEAALLVTGLDEKSTVTATRERLRQMTTPAGWTPAERQKLASMTVVMAMEGSRPDAAVDLAQRILLVDEGVLGGWAVLASSLLLRLADELVASTAVLDRLVARSREQASAWTYCMAIGARADNHIMAGDLAEAEADARTSLETAEQEAWKGNVVIPTIALANVRFLQGHPGTALEMLDGLVRPRLEDFVWEYHHYLMARAGATAEAGDVDGALELFRRCGTSLDESGISNPVFMPWWARSAVLLADTGRAGAAAAMVERGEELASRWGTARGRGLALVSRGVITPGPRGVEVLREAVAVLDGSPARLELVLAHHRFGRALLEVGHVAGAREQLRLAATLAARCGSLRAATAARDLLVQAGGRMRRPTGSPLDALTNAERRVAVLAVGGARNREIAEILFVTLRTVELHLTSAFRKLGVADRAGLSVAVANAAAITATASTITVASA